MTIFAYIAMFGWVPVVLVLFATLPARRAATIALIGGWLLLPMASLKVTGLPDYNKTFASVIGILLGTLIFDPNRLFALRPRLADIPMFVWCISPFFASMSNGLGAYDGASEAMRQTCTWGLAYLVGRLYFADLEGLRYLCVGIIMGGLVYVPLCLFEARFSPQLHRVIYGFRQHEFGQHIRWGGYRPMVFLYHGLSVAFWMGSCTLVAYWMWTRRVLREVWRIPIPVVTFTLLAVLLICKSIAPAILIAAGLVALRATLTRWPRVVLVTLVLIPPVYVSLRASQTLKTADIMGLLPFTPDGEQALSLQTRLDNEDQLSAKALQQPWFGWGGWGRAHIYTDYGKKISVTDGLWIIEFGNNGLVGLVSCMTAFGLPVLLILWRFPARALRHPALAPVAVLTTLVALTALNSLPNAPDNPAILALLGGLGTLPGLRSRWRGRRQQANIPRRVRRIAARQVTSRPLAAPARPEPHGANAVNALPNLSSNSAFRP